MLTAKSGLTSKVGLKAKKGLKKKGKVTLAYETWRDEVAKPYLDTTYGHKCACRGCMAVRELDVDHIINRTNLNRQDLKNIQYLCRPCHINKTAKIECVHGITESINFYKEQKIR